MQAILVDGNGVLHPRGIKVSIVSFSVGGTELLGADMQANLSTKA